MAKTRGGSTKPFVHVASKIKKQKAEEVLKTCKKKLLEKHEFDSEMKTMTKIDNYQYSSVNASNNV